MHLAPNLFSGIIFNVLCQMQEIHKIYKRFQKRLPARKLFITSYLEETSNSFYIPALQS